MLGFEITIRKQSTEAKLAYWVVGGQGIGWIRELVSQGLAKHVIFGAYPSVYEVKAAHVLPFLKSKQIPDYRGTFPLVYSENSVRIAGPETDLEFCDEEIQSCSDDEILTVTTWDMS